MRYVKVKVGDKELPLRCSDGNKIHVQMEGNISVCGADDLFDLGWSPKEIDEHRCVEISIDDVIIRITSRK